MVHLLAEMVHLLAEMVKLLAEKVIFWQKRYIPFRPKKNGPKWLYTNKKYTIQDKMIYSGNSYAAVFNY